MSLVALTATVYVTLCYIFGPISFGPIQFRISEVLCLLAIDYPWAILGVSIGCQLVNTFIGGLGMVDIVFGTLSTVISCLLAYLFRNRLYMGYPIISALMFVIVNALIIGTELAYILNTPKLLFVYMLQVGIGELLVTIIGLPIYKKVKKVIDSKVKLA